MLEPAERLLVMHLSGSIYECKSSCAVRVWIVYLILQYSFTAEKCWLNKKCHLRFWGLQVGTERILSSFLSNSDMIVSHWRNRPVRICKNSILFAFRIAQWTIIVITKTRSKVLKFITVGSFFLIFFELLIAAVKKKIANFQNLAKSILKPLAVSLVGFVKMMSFAFMTHLQLFLLSS